MGSELCEGCPLHAPHEKPFRPPLLNIKHLSAAQSQSQEPGTGRGRVSSTGRIHAQLLSGQNQWDVLGKEDAQHITSFQLPGGFHFS